MHLYSVHINSNALLIIFYTKKKKYNTEHFTVSPFNIQGVIAFILTILKVQDTLIINNLLALFNCRKLHWQNTYVFLLPFKCHYHLNIFQMFTMSLSNFDDYYKHVSLY